MEVREYVDIFATKAAYYELGRLHERRQEWGEALQAYERALARDPDYRPALKRSAAMLLRRGDQGDEQEARDRARRARELEARDEDERAVGPGADSPGAGY